VVRAGSDPLAEELYGDDDFDVVDAVRAVAAERGLPPAQVALAWLLGKPVVTLSEDEVARLEAPYRPHPVLGHS